MMVMVCLVGLKEWLMSLSLIAVKNTTVERVPVLHVNKIVRRNDTVRLPASLDSHPKMRLLLRSAMHIIRCAYLQNDVHLVIKKSKKL